MNHESSTMLLDAPAPDQCKESCGASTPPTRPGKSPLPAPDWLDRGQIPGLDGLRAIAVILVMLVHCYRTPGFPSGDILRSIALRGYFGVDVFFVISGFLITTLLLREMERTGTVNLTRFFLRRFLRILPVYFSVITVVAVCQFLGFYQLESRDWIAALTYTTNFIYHPSWEIGHSWSLAIEEHFYLLWPIALFAGGLAGGWRVVAGCMAGCWVARCFVALVVPHFCSPADATYYASMAESWTFTRLDTIAVGCWLAMACRLDHWRVWLDRLTHPALMFVYFVLTCISIEFAGNHSKYHLCLAYTLNSVLVALLMWGMIRSEGFVRSLLNNRVARMIGVGSYSIYLWQQLFIHPHRSGWLHEFPQNVILAFVAAFLSYWIIELPSNRLKEHLAR